MPVIAATDIGTNTVNFIAASCHKGQFEIIRREKFTVKLGSGGFQDHLLTPSSMERTVKALRKIGQIVAELAPHEHICVATSAVRNASNADEFVDVIRQDCGILVSVIDGQREAQLIAEGVLMAGPLALNKLVLIMDIGGGSTEFVLCRKSRIEWSKSYPTGASKMLELHPTADPIGQDETASYLARYSNHLADLFQVIEATKPQVFIGCSGSFHSFHKIFAASHEGAAKQNGHLRKIPAKAFRSILKDLLGMTFEERLAVKGLSPFRAELINIAGLQIKAVLDTMKVSQIWYSEYAIKEGLLHPYVYG